VADARSFDLPGHFDAVISTGDSLNHMLTEADFVAVVRSVFRSLAPGGRFMFDMNMAEAFETEWRNSSTDTGDDHLIYVRGGFDRSAKLGRTDVTLFRLNGSWLRQDLTIYQRCYRRDEVRRMLIEAGFARVEAHPAKSLGIRGRLSVGRTFFLAYRDPQ
jgi:SAM-dependent methyltransferase